jgi:hypothetical protein
MRAATQIREGWPLAAVAAAAVAIFFVVRLLLPTGESALLSLPIGPEPPAPVYSVAMPEPPAAPVVRRVRPETRIARTVSQPLAVPRALASTPPKPVRKPKVVAKPEPEPAPAPAPAPAPPAPAPAPAPAPEPVRTLASVHVVAPVGNRSPGRAKHHNGPPPGQVKAQSEQAPQTMNPVAAEAVLEANPSPGREKHDLGLPPGQTKKLD